MPQNTLIIGASQAGIELASSLRELNPEDGITLVGAETFAPYQRPPLSKSLHSHDSVPPRMQLRLPAFFDAQRIALHLGERIVEVDLSRGQAVSSSGGVFHFSGLALTVGARARKLAVPGSNLGGITYLRGYADAVSLGSRMETAREVVVIGAGLIGVEFAALAKRCGRTVKIVEMGDGVMRRVASPTVSRMIRDTHASTGIEMMFNTTVVAFHGRAGRVERLTLSDGSEIPADIVLIGIGSDPRTELAAGMGLECRNGVVVDARAMTSAAGVVAAGDCTVVRPSVPNGLYRRFESVSNAIGQAKVAAASLSGKSIPRTGTPWFWSDQGILRLQAAGNIEDATRQEVEARAGDQRLIVRHYREQALVAVECVNCPGEFIAARRQLDAVVESAAVSAVA